ncbi:MAG: sigma-54-dependent Fis family transcriptional regulator, partial [Betaproteobacteria bacterium]
MAGTVANRRAERRSQPVQGAVLVVDDEADIRELLELSLVRMGLAVECAGSVSAAKQLLQSGRYDLCLTDMRLPDGDGVELVRFIGTQFADLPVAVITAFGSTENAVAALKAGAFDYLTKPLSLDQLRALVKSALSLPQQPAAAKAGEHELLGSSPGIEQVRLMIEKLARSQAPVYITGESGSGKELAARLIHKKGARRDKAFVPVNCGAIPENLMESEFFGYKKGAFTGAESDRDGFFQAANAGTLFLDEVADLPLAMQVKLLRAIQEKHVRKVGATSEDSVDVRIICATHQNLASCVESGKFRQDLYYRLAVIELRMPPLRECREDIPVLADAILRRLSRPDGERSVRLSEAAKKVLAGYDFPGNTRELENTLERAVALAASDEIQPEDLQLAPATLVSAEPAGTSARWPLQEYLDRVEKEVILEALEKTRFNRTA